MGSNKYGKYKYNWLAMGLSVSPDICQEIMENIFQHIDNCDVFIDDIGNFRDWLARILAHSKRD